MMTFARIVSPLALVLGLAACGGGGSETVSIPVLTSAVSFDSVSTPTGTLSFDPVSGFSGLTVMDFDRFQEIRAAAQVAGTTLTYEGEITFEHGDTFVQDVSDAEATYSPSTNVLNIDVDANSLVPAFNTSGTVQDFGDTIPTMVDDTIISSDANRTFIGVVVAEFHGDNAGAIAVYSVGNVTETAGGDYDVFAAGALNR